MKCAIVWASRDQNSSKIKIWAQDPPYVETNGVFAGKDYLGISCLANWPGPPMMAGTKKKVAITIMEVYE